MLSNKNMFAIPLCVLNLLLLLFIIIISIIMIITNTFNTMKISNKIRTKNFSIMIKLHFVIFVFIIVIIVSVEIRANLRIIPIHKSCDATNLHQSILLMN